MASDNKKKQVKDLIGSLKGGVSFFLVDFKRIGHQPLEKLRRQLKKSHSRFTVVKNNLLQKAINKLSPTEKELREFSRKNFPLHGKTALITTQKDNWTQPLKAVHELIKKDQSIEFKQGIIEKNIYDQEKLVFLAKLPDKKTLITIIVNQLKSPITSLVRSLKYNQSRFVFVLKRGGEKSK